MPWACASIRFQSLGTVASTIIITPLDVLSYRGAARSCASSPQQNAPPCSTSPLPIPPPLRSLATSDAQECPPPMVVRAPLDPRRMPRNGSPWQASSTTTSHTQQGSRRTPKAPGPTPPRTFRRRTARPPRASGHPAHSPSTCPLGGHHAWRVGGVA